MCVCVVCVGVSGINCCAYVAQRKHVNVAKITLPRCAATMAKTNDDNSVDASDNGNGSCSQALESRPTRVVKRESMLAS